MKISDCISFLEKDGRTGLEHIKIEEYQRWLFKNGVANIPVAYAHLLEKVNGADINGLKLFGIYEENTNLDIYHYNSSPLVDKQNDIIFLGDNFNEYFCYDWRRKKYLTQNKKTKQVTKEFETFEPALMFFMRDYL